MASMSLCACSNSPVPPADKGRGPGNQLASEDQQTALARRDHYHARHKRVSLSTLCLPRMLAVLLAQLSAISPDAASAYHETTALGSVAKPCVCCLVDRDRGTFAFSSGADLEHSKQSSDWLDNRGHRFPGRPPGKHRSFKVPHHGSQTGHHGAVWTQLLVSAPLCRRDAISSWASPAAQDDRYRSNHQS